MKAVCFTGHREVPREDVPMINEELHRHICSLADKGYTDFYTGGAIGFDTIAAHVILDIRDTRNPEIKLHILLPYRSRKLDARSMQADSITAVSEEYYNGCMFKRDRALVDAASVCVCYQRQVSHSGTGYTVGYAEENGLEIIRI